MWLLFELKVDIGIGLADDEGTTFLHLAVYHGHLAAVASALKDTRLSQKIDLVARDKVNATALHYAASTFHWSNFISKMLVRDEPQVVRHQVSLLK